MGKIQVLPSEIAQKIAAGEVIERPFSVVKELVENALDAGATSIRVEVGEGGKKFIRVEDNGCGLSQEDVALCFERHATSKISRAEDLEHIATLGFRGEALASIAAVSRLILKTSEGEGGIKVEREAGRLLRISEGAYPRGTTVEVHELFFNLPARRKFLRSAQAELSLIARYMATVALAFPEIAFSLYHGKRELLNCPGVASRRERLYQLFGREVLERLLEINWEEGEYQISGFISRPPSGWADKHRQFFYVNRRPVRDRLLPAAVQQAVKGWLEKDSFPEVYLFLKVPYPEVDVNVHPAKAEVRFRDSLRVFQLVLNGLKDTLEREARAKSLYPVSGERLAGGGIREIRAGEPEEGPAIPGYKERKILFFQPGEKGTVFPGAEPEKGGEEKEWTVLGQYLNLYIVVGEKNALFIIDQHNAHERVLFERYRELDRRQAWSCRQALFPLLVELRLEELIRLEELQENLKGIGFEVDNLGGRSVVLRSFPDFLQEEEAREVLLAFLQEGWTGDLSRRREHLLATMACRTAVKAGLPLSQEKMEILVAELFRSENPWLCPHGRPIILRIKRREIEKGLKRPSN